MRKFRLALAVAVLGFSTAANASVVNITARVTSGSSFVENGGVTQTTDLTGQLISLSLYFQDLVFGGTTYTTANYSLQPLHHDTVLGITIFGPSASGAELDGSGYDGGHFYDDYTALSVNFNGANLFTNPTDYHTFQVQNVIPAGSTLTATHQYSSFFPDFPDPITSSSGYQIQANLLSINANAVPEPATWMLMIGGFGVIGATLRRRQRVIVRLA